MTDEPWEYRVETFSSMQIDRMKNDLNQLGAEGWELVTMSGIRLTGAEYVLTFKRRGLGRFVDMKTDESGWGG